MKASRSKTERDPAPKPKGIGPATGDDLLQAIEETGQLLEVAKAKMQAIPGLAGTSDEVLDNICSFLGQEILHKTLKSGDDRERLAQIQILLKRQDQLLDKAKFKRETCRKFVEWYGDERVRQILDSRASNGAKIEDLGKIIFGESW